MISKLFTWLCLRWFRWAGWKVPARVSAQLKQYVLVVAPHTSNIDFPIGIAARKILELNVRYVAKKELFVFPIARVLINLGGYPVNRSKQTSFTDQVINFFKASDDFAICVTPEGTRSRVDQWKTGFYYIALGAKVPILMVGFDYERKWVICAEPFLPSGEIDVDFERMDRFFSTIMPKHPELSKYAHPSTSRG